MTSLRADRKQDTLSGPLPSTLVVDRSCPDLNAELALLLSLELLQLTNNVPYMCSMPAA